MEEYRFCPRCGLEREEGHRFCPRCGFSFSAVGESAYGPALTPISAGPSRQRPASGSASLLVVSGLLMMVVFGALAFGSYQVVREIDSSPRAHLAQGLNGIGRDLGVGDVGQWVDPREEGRYVEAQKSATVYTALAIGGLVFFLIGLGSQRSAEGAAPPNPVIAEPADTPPPEPDGSAPEERPTCQSPPSMMVPPSRIANDRPSPEEVAWGLAWWSVLFCASAVIVILVVAYGVLSGQVVGLGRDLLHGHIRLGHVVLGLAAFIGLTAVAGFVRAVRRWPRWPEHPRAGKDVA